MRACQRAARAGLRGSFGGASPLLAVPVLLMLLGAAPLARGRQPSALTKHDHESDASDVVRMDPQAHCDLCEFNWFFVLGAGGRTGSTTALGMFDSIPGFEMSGEHGGLLEHERALIQTVEESLKHGDTPSWKHREPDRHALLCNVQEMVKRVIFGKDYWNWMTRQTKVLGFKEVRYGNLKMAHFLQQVFPCARYVITYREETDVKVKADGFSQKYTSTWENSSAMFQKLSARFNNTYVMLPVEDLTTDKYNDILHGMLGVKNCSFSHILHDNADGGYNEDKTAKTLFDSDCDLSEVDFRLSAEELDRRSLIWRSLWHEQRALGAANEKDVSPRRQNRT